MLYADSSVSSLKPGNEGKGDRQVVRVKRKMEDYSRQVIFHRREGRAGSLGWLRKGFLGTPVTAHVRPILQIHFQDRISSLVGEKDLRVVDKKAHDDIAYSG